MKARNHNNSALFRIYHSLRKTAPKFRAYRVVARQHIFQLSVCLR